MELNDREFCMKQLRYESGLLRDHDNLGHVMRKESLERCDALLDLLLLIMESEVERGE